MFLVDLNSTDDRPIYGQIADRVKFAVAAGVVRPGDLVPSVRELSKQLVVNPNTVARAYRDLQAEGLLESVRGMGLQVAEGALIFAEQPGTRSCAHDYAKQSTMPDRARWTRLRSRAFCVKSGLEGAHKPMAMFGSQGTIRMQSGNGKNHGDLRGGGIIWLRHRLG